MFIAAVARCGRYAPKGRLRKLLLESLGEVAGGVEHHSDRQAVSGVDRHLAGASGRIAVVTQFAIAMVFAHVGTQSVPRARL